MWAARNDVGALLVRAGRVSRVSPQPPPPPPPRWETRPVGRSMSIHGRTAAPKNLISAAPCGGCCAEAGHFEAPADRRGGTDCVGMRLEAFASVRPWEEIGACEIICTTVWLCELLWF